MKLSIILETPYLYDEELPYKILSKTSKEQLARAYDLFGTVDDTTIFKNKISGGYIAGLLKDGELKTALHIISRKQAYPTQPTKLEKIAQVAMVNVSQEFAERGFAKKVYNQLAKQVDLVSDHEQYLGAKGLWKSLARESDINVYVFKEKDYVRDAQGKIVKYNGENIDDKSIWGSTPEHKTVLLVATVKELK